MQLQALDGQALRLPQVGGGFIPGCSWGSGGPCSCQILLLCGWKLSVDGVLVVLPLFWVV